MRRFVLQLAFCTLFFAPPLCAEEPFVVATPGFSHPVVFISRDILREALAELGRSVEIVTLPPSRAAFVFDRGEVDAYIFADVTFGMEHRGAVRLEPPIAVDSLAVFSMDRRLCVSSWAELRGHSIGYEKGMLAVERRMQGFTSDPSENALLAFRKLAAGRTSVVIFPLTLGRKTIRSLFLEGKCFEAGILEQVPLSIYLSSRGASLAGPLAVILARMEASGRFRELQRKYLGDSPTQ